MFILYIYWDTYFFIILTIAKILSVFKISFGFNFIFTPSLNTINEWSNVQIISFPVFVNNCHFSLEDLCRIIFLIFTKSILFSVV